MRLGTEGLADDLRRQRDFVRDREPVYARLLELLLGELPALASRLEQAWEGRTFFAWYDRPLLVLGSIRYDALSEGTEHPLWEVVAGGAGADREPTIAQLRAAMHEERARFWAAVSERAVQTNETTRAVTWLWPASLLARTDAETPLHVVDVGASAGLNLVADDDALRMEWTDEAGVALPTGPLPPIATRLGLDLSPLDVLDEDSARWLRACVWPSDAARLDRLERAIEAYRRAAEGPSGPVLERCPVEDVPGRVERVGEGERLLVLQTLMRDYLSPAQRQEYERGLTEMIASRPPGATLWAELEAAEDLSDPDRSSVLRVHSRERGGGVATLVLAHTHPHPRRLFVNPDQVERLVRAL